MAVVTASLGSCALCRAVQEPFLGSLAQPMPLAKLLAGTWTGAAKSHSLHLEFYCEIKLCLDLQSLAQAVVCIS